MTKRAYPPEVERLIEAAKNIEVIIEAHAIDTFDCDRSGETYCDCLARARGHLKAALAAVEGKTK